MSEMQSSLGGGDYGPPRLSIELTNICNLHCSYCLRDEDALYHTSANFFSTVLFKRIITEASDSAGITHLVFTGGEPTLHPKFAEILEASGSAGLRVSFITNGWNFEKIWPLVLKARNTISSIGFSVDGATAAEHDAWRGAGSFVRLMRAFSRCNRAGIPFSIKVGIRRDTLDKLETLAMFAARIGATGLNFGHLLPTSSGLNDESALSFEERRIAEQEIASLARIFRMNIGIDVGYYNVDPAPPCSPLKGTSVNIDYLGRLTLCCNLSGFRGATREDDVVADLNLEPFATAHARLRRVADEQMQRRAQALANLRSQGKQAGIFTGSPCLHCLQSFGKIPWHDASLNTSSANRSLPVMTTTSA